MTAYQRTGAAVLLAAFLFVASFLVLGGWDLILIGRGQLAGNSASRFILDTARVHPVWVFLLGLALGVLVGHFGWPQRVG